MMSEKDHWSFDEFPWLKEMHDSQAPYNVGQKAAQLGYSETMMNIAMFQMDVMGRDVLYILPNARPVATDFSVTRVDKMIEMSPHLKKLFHSCNTGLKVTTSKKNLYIRGANSESGLKSIPTPIIIFDEFDEMPKQNINLAEERSSGQSWTLDWKISTPTTPEFGINVQFLESTMEHYHFKCPSCSRLIELRFPDNFVITSDDPNSDEILKSHIICGECKAILPHEGKKDMFKTARWVPQSTGRIKRGFYINQLYSCRLHPYKIAKLFLTSRNDTLAEQEFFNSKMGMPHTVDGAQIDDQMLAELYKDYDMWLACRSNHIVTMGVDVGHRQMHVEIVGWDVSKCNLLDINANAQAMVLWAGEVKDWEQLDPLMIEFGVKSCVVDSQPDNRGAESFAKKWYGRARLCRYNHHLAARNIQLTTDHDKNDIYVLTNRTSWLDCALGRFRNKSIMLPRNLPRDYADHIKAQVRRPSKNNHGELVFKYDCPDSKADHYAHARNYSEIALLFALGNKQYINSGVKL